MHRQFSDIAHRRGGLALCRTKRGEIVAADQMHGSRAHRAVIEPTKNPACPRVRQWRSHGRIQDPVVVAATARAVARMKIIVHLAGPANRNRRGKEAIDATHPRGQRTPGNGVEMNDLVKRVDAGIGTAGADGGHCGSGDLRERAFKRVLNAAAVGLRLPAGECGAVVLDAECDAHRVTLRAGGADPQSLAFDLLDQIDRGLPLLTRAVTHDFVEQLARAVFDAQIDITPC